MARARSRTPAPPCDARRSAARPPVDGHTVPDRRRSSTSAARARRRRSAAIAPGQPAIVGTQVRRLVPLEGDRHDSSAVRSPNRVACW